MARSDERSLNDLKNEAERSRTQLAETVDRLRSKVSETATEVRERASPEAVKAEISDYIKAKADALADKARQNPLQAAAIGIGVGYPLVKIARSIPAPVLMVGAGLFLLGSGPGQRLTETVSKKAAAAAEGVSESFGATVEGATQKLHDAQDMASSGLATARETISSGLGSATQQAAAFAGSLDQLKDGAANLADLASGGAAGLKQRAVDTLGAASDAVGGGVASAGSIVRERAGSAVEFGANTGLGLRDQAVEGSQKISSGMTDLIQKNPLLVGGLGLTIGMLIASALPKSDIEQDIMGSVSAEAHKRVKEMASQQFDTVKDLASDAIAGIAEHAGKEGLTPADLNATAEDIGRRVRKVAESASDSVFGYANEKTIDAT
jgi:ElaB/YqjD/DUF883 family membrane-anchored ribosome-binding protein